MSINLDLAARCEKNPKKSYIAAVTIFLKLLSNIIDQPSEEKFRKFKKSNQRISSEMLSCDGMTELIFDVGFELDGDEFVLRRGGLGVISKLKAYRFFFQKRLDSVSSSSSSAAYPVAVSKGAVQKVKSAPARPKIAASQPFHERIRFPQVLKTGNNFLHSLEQLSDSTMQYEDKMLQQSAMSLMPTEKFKLNAIEKLRDLQKLIKSGEVKEEEPNVDDFILEELAEWFKNDFFTWINSMPCKNCGNEGTDAVGIRTENGVRIERYSCNKSRCNTITEFPRYNDIAKLLVTRSGRCGEFANCFTFLARCLGFDARYVYSTSDHVWTEVYNHSKKRFIHVDPSENVFDSPLMYEAGWKRKLEYVIGFSRDDVQDVTWRYSSDHEALKTRRMLCGEKELIEALMALRAKRQATVSKGRKKFLTLRILAELSELLIMREPTENERKGRSSGSLSWRLQRGEANNSKFHVITLNDEEKRAKSFTFRYSCARDSYERINSPAISGWSSLVFSATNIFRKVEPDHKQAYLARTEDSATGELQFSFDFTDSRIKSIDLKFDTKTYESGAVQVEFINANDKVTDKDQLINASKFRLSARLSGGKGDVAWQHAQVFRQSLNDAEFPFQLLVKFH